MAVLCAAVAGGADIPSPYLTIYQAYAKAGVAAATA